MVGVGPQGEESVAARVSIVNRYGKCVYDKFIKPAEPVTDYRTEVSGVRPEDLRNGMASVAQGPGCCPRSPSLRSPGQNWAGQGGGEQTGSAAPQEHLGHLGRWQRWSLVWRRFWKVPSGAAWRRCGKPAGAGTGQWEWSVSPVAPLPRRMACAAGSGRVVAGTPVEVEATPAGPAGRG